MEPTSAEQSTQTDSAWDSADETMHRSEVEGMLKHVTEQLTHKATEALDRVVKKMEVLAAERGSLADRLAGMTAENCRLRAEVATLPAKGAAASTTTPVEDARVQLLVEFRTQLAASGVKESCSMCPTCDRPVFESDGYDVWCEYCYHKVRPTLGTQERGQLLEEALALSKVADTICMRNTSL